MATLLGAVTLTVVSIVGAYHWHRWVLLRTQPYGDPSEQWFIHSRQHMFDWATPMLAGFILVASFAIWYAIAQQPNHSSYDEILRELAYARIVHRGLADSEAGNVIPDAEIKQDAPHILIHH